MDEYGIITPTVMSGFVDIELMDRMEREVSELLIEHGGFGRTPWSPAYTKGYAPQYDMILDFGGPDVLRFEIKTSCQSWLPVEISNNGRYTGLGTTKADAWVFLTVGGTKFESHGTKLQNGSMVECKVNVIKPSTLVSHMLKHQDDADYVRSLTHEDGTTVVYVNPFKLRNSIYMGGCKVLLRPHSEVGYNSSEVKSFDLKTFHASSGFSLTSVMQQVGKFDNEDDQLRAEQEADRLADIVNTSHEIIPPVL